MRSKPLSLVTILLLVIASIGLPLPAGAQRLVVVSRGANALVVHALPGGEETARVAVGEFPHEVAIDPVRGIALIASYGGSTVHAVDLAGLSVRAFQLEGHRALHGIHPSRDGETVWVTAEQSEAILELDAGSGAVRRQWSTQGLQSHMLTASPDGRYLYVANIGSGDVSVIDRQRGTTTRITTGAGAEGIDITPDGSEVWVSNRGDNTVSVIATATQRVAATIETGGAFPVKVRIRPGGGEVWIANNRSGTIAVIDRVGRRLAATIDVGSRPLGIAFSPDGRRAWVTRPGADEIVEIDAVARTVLRRLTTGPNPDGIAWVP